MVFLYRGEGCIWINFRPLIQKRILEIVLKKKLKILHEIPVQWNNVLPLNKIFCKASILCIIKKNLNF